MRKLVVVCNLCGDMARETEFPSSVRGQIKNVEVRLDFRASVAEPAHICHRCLTSALNVLVDKCEALTQKEHPHAQIAANASR